MAEAADGSHAEPMAAARCRRRRRRRGGGGDGGDGDQVANGAVANGGVAHGAGGAFGFVGAAGVRQAPVVAVGVRAAVGGWSNG